MVDNNREEFGVVTACNNGYYPGVVALIKSLKRNSPLPVTVIDQGMEAGQVKHLEELGANVISVTRCIDIDDERFGCCYVLFDIDEAPYDRILYLDADMLVFDDLSHMDELIKEHKFVYSYENTVKLLNKKRYKGRLRRLFSSWPEGKQFLKDYPEYAGIRGFFRRRESTLNSGILGVDKALFQKLKTGISKYGPYLDRFRFPDQNLLSLLRIDFGVKGYALGYEYNACRIHGHTEKSVQAELFQHTRKFIELSFEDHRLYLKANHHKRGIPANNLLIKVLHYNNVEKPWKPDVVLAEGFKEVWEYYFNLEFSR